ncbi:unnamed protein product, partial [Iphiclides podalirius]
MPGSTGIPISHCSDTIAPLRRWQLLLSNRAALSGPHTRDFLEYGYNLLFTVPSSAVTDPRDGRRVALKKLPNVFQSLVSSKRVFRELKMLCFFKHENVLSALDILQPPSLDFFQEMYPLLCTLTCYLYTLG